MPELAPASGQNVPLGSAMRAELLALDAVAAAVLVCDRGGVIRFANAHAALLLSATPDDVTGAALASFAVEGAALIEAVAACARRDGVEARLRASDGTSRDCVCSVRELGGSELTVVTVNDVTARRAEEAESRFQKILLKAQSDTSLDGILVVSPDSKFVSINRRFVEMWALPTAIQESRSDEAALKWVLGELADPDAFIAKVVYLYAHPDEESRDEILLRDGRTFDRYSAPVLGEGGVLYGRVWFFRDITERKSAETERARLLEREQRARQYAEDANRAKDEFLAMVSHELRTPLTAVLGWANMLLSGKHTPNARDKALATIERNARLQAKLIDEILEVSRVMSGKIRLNVSAVDLSSLIVTTLESVRPAAAAKRLTLKSQIERSSGQVSGDADRLQQVVYNLLTNAIKFTPAGGNIQVALGRSGENATITVRDDGKGISADFLPHVFDRFRQADSTSTRGYGGLGLGLAIVRHLIELHGGTVRAESDGEGHGSLFTIELPVRAIRAGSPPRRTTRRTPASKPPPAATALRDVRILVVDDHRDARELIAAALEGFGAEVTQSDSAIEALARFDESELEIDMLVSDVSMPLMDGHTFVRELRSRPRGAAIPALALTANASPRDRESALVAGFQAHLSKPVDPETLVATLVQLLRPKAAPRRSTRAPRTPADAPATNSVRRRA